MKRILVLLLALSLTITVPGFAAGQTMVSAGDQPTVRIEQHELAPINREAYRELLIKKGLLTKNATPDAVDKAIKKYVGDIRIKTTQDSYQRKLQTRAAENLKTIMNQGQNKKNALDPVTEQPYGDVKKEVRILTILIEFPDYPHNSITEGETGYWTNDFNVEHYKQLLFNDKDYTTASGITSPSMRSYYYNQSNGNLKVSGNVFGWFTAEFPAAYYGAPTADSNDARPRELVYEAVQQAVAAGVDLSDYDLEDPYDLDGDNDIYEPDGIVDHLMVLHSGMGEDEGGGALGADAIWSHSWSMGGLLAVPGSDKYIYTYTTEPENGAVGVMAHEFAHDLGIPDDYDTEYTSAGDIVEYWSIMAGGSWAGYPAGTQPVGINPWGRIQLGSMHGGQWTNWAYLPLDQANGVSVQLTANSINPAVDALQSVVVGLPKQVIKVASPTEGQNAFWGTDATDVDNWFSFPLDLTTATSPNLTYDVYYQIENEWDAAFVQISTDNGTTWTSLSTPSMKTWNNPDAAAEVQSSMPGYTGASEGFISETIDLSGFIGSNVLLRMRYVTDSYVSEAGVYFDNINVVDGTDLLFSNGAENGFEGLENHGFEINAGTKMADHYYVAEWRSYQNVDKGLTELARARFDYNRGMVLWYKNDLFDNNWVGQHPGYGYLGVVDAQQYVYQVQGMSSVKNNNNAKGNNANAGSAVFLSSWVNLKDAAFSIDANPATDFSVYAWASPSKLQSTAAVPTFDDSKSYFSAKNPDGGLKLPGYGLKITVTGRALDYSTGKIFFQVGK